MKIGVKFMHDKAEMPSFQTEGAACFDVSCVSKEPFGKRSMIYDTGLAFEIPDGYDLEFYSRSGHGFKHDLRLANGVAQIDNDFKGSVKIKLTYDGPPYGNPEWPWVGDRVAQAKLVKKVKTEFVKVDTLKETKRGDNGFGSTDE